MNINPHIKLSLFLIYGQTLIFSISPPSRKDMYMRAFFLYSQMPHIFSLHFHNFWIFELFDFWIILLLDFTFSHLWDIWTFWFWMILLLDFTFSHLLDFWTFGILYFPFWVSFSVLTFKSALKNSPFIIIYTLFLPLLLQIEKIN